MDKIKQLRSKYDNPNDPIAIICDFLIEKLYVESIIIPLDAESIIIPPSDENNGSDN